MSVQYLTDVEFGVELPEFKPDTTLKVSSQFAEAIGYGGGGGRFDDHEKARAEGFPGAIVPGVMGMGFFVRMIHEWAPKSKIIHIDTVFRAPMLADHSHVVTAVVTDIDEDESQVVLDLSIKNDKDETRVFGTATVVIPKD